MHQPDSLVRDSRLVRLGDGATVSVSLVVPGVPRAAVVCLPALGVAASYYEPLAVALASRGIAAATADLRGAGTSSVRPRRGVDFGYARLVDDAAAIVGALRERLAVPVHALGHSLGGQVGALLAGSRPGVIAGLMLVACGTPYWRRFPPRTGLQILVFAHLARVLALMLGYYPGNRVGFAGVEAAQLMREWSGFARRGRLDIGGLAAEQALADARLPVLAVSMARDWLAPPAAVDHLAGKLAGAAVERVHVTGDAADARALDHFRWARHPDAIAAIVDRWVAARGPDYEPNV